MIVIETPPNAGEFPIQEYMEEQDIPASAPVATKDYVDAEPDPDRPCPNCSKPMTYIEQYGRYYCYDCEIYGAKDGTSKS
jgi:hypothetical protein